MNNEKINSISILRIIATLMIVMVHFGQSLPLPNILHKFVMYGAEGVTIFFIISGYLIAMSLDRNPSTLTFYKKRIIRIVPLYYGVVFINIIASLFLRTYPSDVTHIGWLRYILFIHAIIPANDYFYWNNCAALWSMSAFALFYLLAPLIHKLVMGQNNNNSTNAKSMAILWGGVFLSLISEFAYSRIPCDIFEESNSYLAIHSPFTVIFEFLMGMYIYYLLTKGKGENKMLLMPIFGIGLIGSIFKLDRFVVTALFGLLVYCISEIELNCSSKKNHLILKKIDEYSFSIYLGHTTVMFIFSRIQELFGFSNIRLAMFDLIGCIIFIPILHELIEKQGGKLMGKLLRRLI